MVVNKRTNVPIALVNCLMLSFGDERVVLFLTLLDSNFGLVNFFIVNYCTLTLRPALS
jgi:hypothetical protein